ncbi:MAG: hypothetical protein WB341_02680, partial [Terracidiphilus sp.]
WRASAQIASNLIAATTAPMSTLIQSVNAKTRGSSFSSPREASSHARQSHRIISAFESLDVALIVVGAGNNCSVI